MKDRYPQQTYGRQTVTDRGSFLVIDRRSPTPEEDEPTSDRADGGVVAPRHRTVLPQRRPAAVKARLGGPMWDQQVAEAHNLTISVIGERGDCERGHHICPEVSTAMRYANSS